MSLSTRKVEEPERLEKSPAWDLGEELRALLTLAIPVVLSELAWMSMSVVDTIMVGHLSAEAIGAVGLSSGLYYVPSLFGLGLLLGLDTLVSQAYGRNDDRDCLRWLTQGLYIAAATAVPAMLIVHWLPVFLPRWGTNPEVAAQAVAYLRLLNWGTPWLLIYAAFRRYLQGMAVVRPVTFALVSANLVNLAGNWALIYGRLGFPAMGVRGSALSTVLARIYMAGFLVA
jgi:MATE family multidrug resistance protein